MDSVGVPSGSILLERAQARPRTYDWGVIRNLKQHPPRVWHEGFGVSALLTRYKKILAKAGVEIVQAKSYDSSIGWYSMGLTTGYDIISDKYSGHFLPKSILSKSNLLLKYFINDPFFDKYIQQTFLSLSDLRQINRYFFQQAILAPVMNHSLLLITTKNSKIDLSRDFEAYPPWIFKDKNGKPVYEK